jgi:hypothetical protein
MSKAVCETAKCRICKKVVNKILCRDELCERCRLKQDEEPQEEVED